jgi:hypothetical protein
MASLTDRWYHPRERANTAHGTGGRVGPDVGMDAVKIGEISLLTEKKIVNPSDVHPIA